MNSRIILTSTRRPKLLKPDRTSPDLEVRFRAHRLRLLADGHTWEAVSPLLVLQVADQFAPSTGRAG